MFDDKDTKNYKRWAILQKLSELKKALKRSWSQDKQERFDNLKKDLEDYP